MSRINRHLLARVREYLEEHPSANANEVYRALGGRRQDVLRAVRSVRRAEGTGVSTPARAGRSTRFPIAKTGRSAPERGSE